MKDSQAKTEAKVQDATDANFKVLDERLQGMLKNAERTIAVIMVAAFMVGFTISQIVRLQIERIRRKALVKMAIELETRVAGLQQEAVKLTGIVHELKGMESKYTASLGALKPKPFLSPRVIFLGLLTFVIGAAAMFFIRGMI